MLPWANLGSCHRVVRADVVLCTTVGAAALAGRMAQEPFDVVVVDEAGQSLEVGCWIPIMHGHRVVLAGADALCGAASMVTATAVAAAVSAVVSAAVASLCSAMTCWRTAAGDHKQLPPTIKSMDAERAGLGVTMFERASELAGGQATFMLDTQFRMHHTISDWASAAMYGGQLKAHESVAHRALGDIALGVTELDEDTQALLAPMLLIDTAGCDMADDTDAESGSKFNEAEARAVCRHVELLCETGVSSAGIGVISPYNGQVRRAYSVSPCVGAMAAHLYLFVVARRCACCAACCKSGMLTWRSAPLMASKGARRRQS